MPSGVEVLSGTAQAGMTFVAPRGGVGWPRRQAAEAGVLEDHVFNVVDRIMSRHQQTERGTESGYGRCMVDRRGGTSGVGGGYRVRGIRPRGGR